MQVGAITDPVVTALKQAASATGSDFHYLLGTAMRESSLKPAAQSASSSATGLFQFVDQTWLGLVKDHGAKYGLGNMSDAISVDGAGHYRVLNDANRQAILELRKNPQISALMAGEYTKASAASLQAALGRPVCGGELYAAHFLGPDAACKLIRAQSATPNASAAQLLPSAAAANKSVFFHADGSPKSVKEVYDWALQQPGGSAPVRAEGPMPAPLVRLGDAAAAPGAPMQATAFQHAVNASSSDIEMLLASVMNWQPGGNFFAPGQDPSPMTPLALTPGLLNILSES